MALSVTNGGSSNTATGSTSHSVTTGVSFAQGDLIIVCVGCDNSATGGSSPITGMTDTAGNSYSLTSTYTQDPLGGNAGAVAAVFTAVCNSTGLTASDTITLNLSLSTPAKTLQVYKVTGSGFAVSDAGGTGATAAGADTMSMTTPSMSAGQLFVGTVAQERNAGSTTADSDTTNGTWSTIRTELADGGSNGASIRSHSQHKTVNATGAQSWDVTIAGAADWAMCGIIVTESGGTVTGTVAVTEGADTSSAAAAHGVTGTAAQTSGADTSSASGSSVTGNAAPIEAVDTSSGTGAHGVSGSGSPSEQADTAAGSGTYTFPTVTGTGAPVEQADTSAASGSSVTGSATVTAAADTVAGSGVHGVAGTSTTTTAADTSTGTGSHGVAGTAATIEAADTSSSSGVHGITGSGAPLGQSDTAAGSGFVFVPEDLPDRPSSVTVTLRSIPAGLVAVAAIPHGTVVLAAVPESELAWTA